MIERDPPFYWDVSCDGCSSGEERVDSSDAPTFQAVVSRIKEYGWRVVRRDGEWRYLCPACADGREAR